MQYAPDRSASCINPSTHQLINPSTYQPINLSTNLLSSYPMKLLPQVRNLCIGITLFLGITFEAKAQITQDYLQQFIEFITENQDGGEEFDYSEIGEQLDDWSRSPIDINSPEA